MRDRKSVYLESRGTHLRRLRLHGDCNPLTLRSLFLRFDRQNSARDQIGHVRRHCLQSKRRRGRLVEQGEVRGAMEIETRGEEEEGRVAGLEYEAFVAVDGGKCEIGLSAFVADFGPERDGAGQSRVGRRLDVRIGVPVQHAQSLGSYARARRRWHPGLRGVPPQLGREAWHDDVGDTDDEVRTPSLA